MAPQIDFIIFSSEYAAIRKKGITAYIESLLMRCSMRCLGQEPRWKIILVSNRRYAKERMRIQKNCLLKPMRWNPVVVGPEKRQPLQHLR